MMFQGKASKKWDGKTIAVEEEDLEGEYSGVLGQLLSSPILERVEMFFQLT